MNWAGTDVLKAKDLFDKNMHSNKYIYNINHFCVSTWLKEELNELNINANILNVTIIRNKKNNIYFNKDFKILAYIGKDRPEFYGIENIIKLAKKFSYIEFRVVGLDCYSNIPNNLKLLGWVSKIEKEYLNCVVYIRSPKHDGMPFSVIEALSYGRVVLYNYKLPYVNFFDDYNDLEIKLQKIIDNFSTGKLNINYNAIEYITREFSRKKVLENLIGVFKKVIKE